MSLCITVHRKPTISETFIRSHAERLGGGATLVYGEVPYKDGESLWSDSAVARLYTKGTMLLSGRRKDVTHNYLRAFRKLKTTVVLAEYGTAGVLVMEACRRAKIPLIVHFHGFDASVKGVLEKHRDNYRALFEICTAIVVPSRAMKDQLISLGAPSAKIACNSYGVDCSLFKPAAVEHSPPVFLAVGRLVDKKGPHLTILAFAQLAKNVPEARLRMIGEGPLLGPCQDLAHALGIQESVTFLGAQSHDRVREEMQQARAFIQHSVQALNGDSEGTPVSIMEAGASGLPVVSTRHAGIPDIVVEQETGFLVEERDVGGMANHMQLLADDPRLASKIGRAARQHIESGFAIEQSISRLSSIIAACTEGLIPRSGLALAAYERS
jgi:colanic acid/amylovoran biosynthesis glycosyltransferase